MVYIDQVHMITDGPIEELHEFAESIGLKREWFQDKKGKFAHPHYDVTSIRIWGEAIRRGAKYVTTKTIVRHLRRIAQSEQKEAERND